VVKVCSHHEAKLNDTVRHNAPEGESPLGEALMSLALFIKANSWYKHINPRVWGGPIAIVSNSERFL